MSFEKSKVMATLGQAYAEGLKVGGVLDALGLSRKEQGRMRRFLEGLVRDGEVEKIARGTYALAKGRAAPQAATGQRERTTRRKRAAARHHVPYSADEGGPQATGRIRVHPAGYGFVVREDGHDDVFIPEKYRGQALDGDRVLVYTWQGFKGTEGRVEEILARGRAKLTGVVETSGRTLFVVPDDPRIATDFGRVGLEGSPGEARPGDCVVVEITRYPTDYDTTLDGRILKVLGPPG